MSSKFLLQTMLLLFFGQVLLGGLGWLLVSAAPWAGLPVTVLLIWFIRRVARIFREEMAKAARQDQSVQPVRLSLVVALLAQVPGLALLPFWAPAWILTLWQGAVWPIFATLGLFWAEGAVLAQPWLWLAVILEVALFVWTSVAWEEAAQTYTASPIKAAAGDWAPARRHGDIQRRGRRVK